MQNQKSGSIKDDIISMIIEIKDPWILKQIYRFIKGITKED